jgi:hypothetical protein
MQSKNCGNHGECGNKYLHTPHHLWKCVVAKQVDKNSESILGLKVGGGYFIPVWAVIGEYTGKVVRGGRGRKTLTMR